MAACNRCHPLAGWGPSSLACCVDDPVGRSYQIIISVPPFRPLTLDAGPLAGAPRDVRLLGAAATVATASHRLEHMYSSGVSSCGTKYFRHMSG